ncbi:MAG: hypothetical protein KJ904_03630 [Alphaproteobacteria bacterium]|nr:hypothetical protein [Alphaproteobacteria bacterium]MBU0799356.1 hypothetical protein [Alphaproteobacteria bacterium]MBU0886231.1 hypothetical protein [Alphaproteobacteria bacterium]MBU1814184.1 hypothetical protein [Alphaproteobacteria bacterium]MBU2089916.1 hypothetical protein [Alphaproteobacteria bacterium]
MMLGQPAQAADPVAPAQIDDALIEQIRTIASHSTVLISIKAQNERHTALTQADIDALDKQWVEQRKSDNQPLIAQVLGSPLSGYLIREMAQSRGLIVEMFVMDNKGLNVGQSSITGDYWQGDEAKYQKTFLVGPDAVFPDKVSVEKETGHHLQQVNLTIKDPADGKPVGAITVEIDLDMLAMRRQQAAR